MEALQAEIEKKKQLLQQLNENQSDEIIRQKLSRLESLEKETAALQEVLIYFFTFLILYYYVILFFII